MRFGDYTDFDKWLDDKNPELLIEDIPIQASKALYSLEFDEYQQKLRAFLDDRPTVEDDAGFEPGEVVAEDADG